MFSINFNQSITPFLFTYILIRDGVFSQYNFFWYILLLYIRFFIFRILDFDDIQQSGTPVMESSQAEKSTPQSGL